jgi:hypothetical protein
MTMTFSKPWVSTVAIAVIVAATVCAVRALAVDPPAAPKVSTFAPVKDVATQIGVYLARLEEAVATEEAYKDAETTIAKDANTLVLLALAAGLHDEPSAYKAAAPALMKAAQELAKAKTFAAAKAGVSAVKKASESTSGDSSTLKWVRAADLPELMKQVPLVNNRLKRNLRGDRFKSKAKENAGDTATIAVIAQGSIADVSEVKKPGDEEQWFKFCIAMRDAAAALNKALHDGDAAAGEKAAGALNQSCDDCHTVFHPAALEKK